MVLTDQKSGSPAGATSFLKKCCHLVLGRFRINTLPSIKVYHGFGTDDMMHIAGHVLLISPKRQEKFSSRFWKNTLSLLRLFVIKPLPCVKVCLEWEGQTVETETDDTGYFVFRWQPSAHVNEGWHEVTVRLSDENKHAIQGNGRLFVPHPGNYAIVSDIDDTFLVSHSSDLARRLYVLLTSNARTRKPFDSVVKHYQLLAEGDDKFTAPRPFFYVSSSEYNLYDYIREFSRMYQLPDGIYLLSRMKQFHEFWKTGKGKHRLKYFRIARLISTYPNKQFILMGDDSQEDPKIYHQLVLDFPGRIVCVYLRHVRSEALKQTRVFEQGIKDAGVEICYFTHSETAIEHSRSVGLIV